MKKVRKGLLMIIGVCVLCTCCVLGSKTDTVQAAMADEAEDYELEESYTGTIVGESIWDSVDRYYKFTIPEKSHVTLYASVDSTFWYSMEMYNSSGKAVVKSSDFIYTENVTTGKFKTSIFKTSISRTLPAGTYYLDIRQEGDSTRSSTYTFRIQAEKQIKLAKGNIKYLRSKKRGQMTIRCNNATNAIGYRIQYSTDYRFKRGVKTVYSPTKSKTIKGLKKGKRYYVKVCPYTVYYDGTWVFGQNSYVRAVLVK